MATPRLIPQALTTLENAKKYLQDQGDPQDNHTWLALHINAASAWIASFTGRKHLVFKATDITEYRDGDGSQQIYLEEFPVRQITQVILSPFSDAGVTTTFPGPVSPAISTTDMYFIENDGLLVLKVASFREGIRTVQIDYRAGYYAEDEPDPNDAPSPERAMLEMLVLEAISIRWKKWKDQETGIKTRSQGDNSVTYKDSDFSKETIAWLRHLKRTEWV